MIVRTRSDSKTKFEYNGKMYASKKECCEALGISYRSVLSYRYEKNCRFEEAIDHFVERSQQKKFVFRNRKWLNLHNCCQFYGLNEDSVKNYMWNSHCSPAEAVGHHLKAKKDLEFVYKRKRYRSLAECCREYGVNLGSVLAYMDRNKTSAANAITHLTEYRDEKEFAFRDSTYKSMPECCKAFGVNPVSVRDRAKRTGCTWEEAMEHYVSAPDSIRLCINGRGFHSIRECCEAYEINESSVRSRAARTGCSVEESVIHFIERKNNG